MPRLACVNIPELPLQIALTQHPSWRREAVAVISVDSPNGHIVAINQKARERGIRLGMRYATALTLEPRLQADLVPESQQKTYRERIISGLRRFAPRIETCDFDIGTLWIDAEGLFPLYDSFSTWMDSIVEMLREEGLEGRIAVGFSRFGSYLVASSRKEPTVLQNPLEERDIATKASLELLPLPPKVRGRLRDLGIHTVQGFLQLPGSDVARRLGAETAKVYHFASGDLELPFQGVEEEEDFSYVKNLTAPVSGLEEVMTHLDELLERLIVDVTESHLSVQRMRVGLHFEDGARTCEELEPATATTRKTLLQRLLRLRLEGLSLSSRIEGVALSCDAIEKVTRQGNLFGGGSQRRDWQKAAKALALIQAEFGNRSIAVAKTRSGYLPEDQYAWVDAGSRTIPSIGKRQRNRASSEEPMAVRRVLSSPLLLKEEPPGAVRGGPFRYNGGWWAEQYDRRYYYVDDNRGIPLWLYYDCTNRRWYLQGAVQ